MLYFSILGQTQNTGSKEYSSQIHVHNHGARNLTFIFFLISQVLRGGDRMVTYIIRDEMNMVISQQDFRVSGQTDVQMSLTGRQPWSDMV